MSAKADLPQKISLRWKIFRVVNFIQAFISMAFALLILLYAFDEAQLYDIIWISLIILLFVSISINNFFNLHLLNKYYPDAALTPFKEKTATVLMILYLLITAGCLFLSIMAILTEIANLQDWIGGIIIFLFIFNSFLGIYIVIEQACLPILINRNNKKAMKRITEEIGLDQ